MLEPAPAHVSIVSWQVCFLASHVVIVVFDFEILCFHVPDSELEPRIQDSAVDYLYPPVAAWSGKNLSPSLFHLCLSILPFASVPQSAVSASYWFFPLSSGSHTSPLQHCRSFSFVSDQLARAFEPCLRCKVLISACS